MGSHFVENCQYKDDLFVRVEGLSVINEDILINM